MRGEGGGGGAPGAPPKIGKNMIFWHKMIYPKNFRTSLRSVQFFKCGPLTCNPGSAPGMGPIRNPRWVQKRTEGYVIVSTPSIDVLIFWILEHLMKVLQETSGGH